MARKCRREIEHRPKAIPKECRCCCPTCRDRWVEESTKLYPDRLNWVFCPKHKENKFKDNDGWRLKDCTDKNNNVVVSETELIIIKEEKRIVAIQAVAEAVDAAAEAFDIAS